MTRFQNTVVRPFTALAGASILTVGLVTVPPVLETALPRTEVHAIQLTAITTADISTVKPAATSPSAEDTTTEAPPDFLAFAASILEYLNSLGLGAGPGLAAIGLSGFVVAFAATAYAWNAFADTVNPGLRFLRIPRVPKFPVCFAGQSCANSASAQVRVAKPARTSNKGASRGVAASSRVTSKPTATKAPGAKKSTSSASGKGGSKRAAVH